VALGRKAWRFVCGVAGGEQGAMMMTLVMVRSVRRQDLDVGVSIQDVLDQLRAGSTDGHRLLPDVWKQRYPEAIREYRVTEWRDKAERMQVRAARRRPATRVLPSRRRRPPSPGRHYWVLMCAYPGSKATRRRSANSGSLNAATRPNASSFRTPAVAWLPAPGSVAPALTARCHMVLLGAYLEPTRGTLRC